MNKLITNISITIEAEFIGMQRVSEAVAYTLKEMRKYVQPGINTKEWDNFANVPTCPF